MRLGKFKQARHSFEMAQYELRSQPNFSLSSVTANDAIRETRLKSQPIIKILTGHLSYGLLADEMENLRSLRDRSSGMSDSLRDELTIWRAKCYDILGNYRQGAYELRQLHVIKKLETSAVSPSLANLPVVGPGSVKSYGDISGLQAFALTLAYQGLLDRAQEIIRSLLGCLESSILPGIRRQDGVSQSLPLDSDGERRTTGQAQQSPVYSGAYRQNLGRLSQRPETSYQGLGRAKGKAWGKTITDPRFRRACRIPPRYPRADQGSRRDMRRDAECATKLGRSER